MSVVRLCLTGLAMAAAAVALLVLAGDPVGLLRTLRGARGNAAAGGAEAVVLAVTGVFAWATWAWGALGLLLTAAGGLPGLPGAVSRGVARALLPERLRAAAALALGMGLVVAGPAAAAPGTPAGPPDWPAVATGSPGPPDWPAEPGERDQPAGPAGGDGPGPAGGVHAHVVVPGDCLWRIAADHLQRSGPPPTDRQIAGAVDDWWSANTDVIGPDPDLIHPGQVLQAPATGPDPTGGSR